MNDRYYIVYKTKSGKKGWIDKRFIAERLAWKWSMEQAAIKKWDWYNTVKV